MAENTDNKNKLAPQKKKNYMGKSGQITSPNCKLCNFEHRAEVEEYYENNPNYNRLKYWINKEYGLSVSYPAVRNHILYHFKAGEQYEKIEGYVGEITKWMNLSTNRLDSLKKRRAILERNLTYLGAEAEDMKSDEKRKHIELMKKLADTLLAYDNRIEEIEGELEPITIVFQQMNVVMQEVLNNTDDKVVVQSAFDSFLKQLEESVKDKIDI